MSANKRGGLLTECKSGPALLTSAESSEGLGVKCLAKRRIDCHGSEFLADFLSPFHSHTILGFILSKQRGGKITDIVSVLISFDLFYMDRDSVKSFIIFY